MGYSAQKNNGGIKPTVVVVDIPWAVGQLKPLLEEQGYKVLSVAIISDGIQRDCADMQEEARTHYKQTIKDSGEIAAAGLDKGVHYKFRIEKEGDVKDLWDVLRVQQTKLPKGARIDAIVVSDHLLHPHTRSDKSWDKLLVDSRPPHSLPSAKLIVNLNM